MGMVRLKALGQSSIEVGDVRIGPEQPYLFAIALYIIVERGKRIPRQALVDLIWPHVKDERHARQRFRQALLRLREYGLPIAGENGTLLLEKSAVETDLESVADAERVEPGLNLEFLPHYSPRISDRFLDWVETQRSRVHASVQRVFLTRMQQARSRGDWAEVDAVATECLRLDPYNEEAVMAHAECAVMRGSKREALSILDGYMEALGAEVGTIGLPAKILRSRIAERLTDQRYAMISEQYFVGRESSMELLLGLLREAKRGAGSAAFIWGEPGIGKSRLVQELTQVATLDGARVVSTKCHPTDAGRPLSAFADLVPMLKTLPGALGCSAQTLSLLQRLTDRNRNESLAPQEAGDAAFLAATIRRAVFDIVDAVADEGLLIMVIEDVHWLDEQSWAILSTMVEWSATRSLVILMTSRTAHATETKVRDPDRGLHRHHLEPLADEASGALLDKLSSSDAESLPEGVRAWSVGAAEGNPFYLRELLRHWLETRQAFGVPRSLAELIEGRLNRLSSLALRALQLCAMLGKHSTFERLEKATGYQNHVLLDAIEELSHAVMLAPDKPEVAVKHDLLSTAALNRLGGAALRLVHRQVAAVLEAEINRSSPAALMWSCAEHWQLAGEPTRALTTVRQCAAHLHAVGHVHNAADLYEKARTICATPEERSEVLLELALTLKSAASWGRLRDLLRDSEGDVQPFVNPKVQDRLHLLKLETEWRLQRRSMKSGKAIATFALDKSKDAEVRVQASCLGIIVSAESRDENVAESLFGILDDLQLDSRHALTLEHARMIYHAEFGSVDRALEHADNLLELSARTVGLVASTNARLNAASCYRLGGRTSEAVNIAKDVLTFEESHGLHAQATWAAMRLAYNALHEEDYETAAEWHRLATAHANSSDDRSCNDALDHIQARLALHRGDLAPAQRYIDGIANSHSTTTVLHRQSYAALASEVALATNAPLNPVEVTNRAEEFRKSCGSGFHDYFALCTYRALVAIEEKARAKNLLEEYVTSRRRDRGPMPPSLRALILQLGIEPKPPTIPGEKEAGPTRRQTVRAEER